LGQRLHFFVARLSCEHHYRMAINNVAQRSAHIPAVDYTSLPPVG